MKVALNIVMKDPKHELSKLMQESLAIYDQTLYFLRQSYFEFVKTKEKKKFLNYYDLCALVKETEAFKASTLDYQARQNSIKQASTNWSLWIKALHAWQACPSKFKKKPRIPGYLHNKKKFNKITLDSTRLRSKECLEDEFRLPKTNFKVKLPNFIKKDQIDCVTILPFYSKIKISIIYEKEVEQFKHDKDSAIGIDIGLDNLLAITADNQSLSWVVKGGKVKSINQFFNKKLAKAQSELMKCNKKHSSKKTQRLYEKRSNILKTYFHQVSAKVIKLCEANGISRVIVGHNKGWKDNCHLGKKTTQNFVRIPYNQLIWMLNYKCKLHGIDFKEVEESYTSKTDHLMLEDMKHLEERPGKRIMRGLFMSGWNNKIVNADINGAIGILRKANELTDEQLVLLRDRGDIVSPEVLAI